jgi:hypothetical protein
MLTEEERKFLFQVHLDVEVDEEDEIEADSRNQQNEDRIDGLHAVTFEGKVYFC